MKGTLVNCNFSFVVVFHRHCLSPCRMPTLRLSKVTLAVCLLNGNIVRYSWMKIVDQKSEHTRVLDFDSAICSTLCLWQKVSSDFSLFTFLVVNVRPHVMSCNLSIVIGCCFEAKCPTERKKRMKISCTCCYGRTIYWQKYTCKTVSFVPYFLYHSSLNHKGHSSHALSMISQFNGVVHWVVVISEIYFSLKLVFLESFVFVVFSITFLIFYLFIFFGFWTLKMWQQDCELARSSFFREMTGERHILSKIFQTQRRQI